MTIRVQILDAGGYFRRRLPLIRRTVESAVAHVESVAPPMDVDLIVHPTDFGPDQFAIAAFTMGPNNIHLGIERSQLSSEELEGDLYRTTVHELHHALRWKSVKRWTVGEAIVLEGLALLADHDALGPQDDVDRPLSNANDAFSFVAMNRDAPLEQHRRWLYTSEPEQPGGIARSYTVGLLVMGAALDALGIDPWAAAQLPTATLLDAGLAVFLSQPGQITSG